MGEEGSGFGIYCTFWDTFVRGLSLLDISFPRSKEKYSIHQWQLSRREESRDEEKHARWESKVRVSRASIVQQNRYREFAGERKVGRSQKGEEMEGDKAKLMARQTDKQTGAFWL